VRVSQRLKSLRGIVVRNCRFLETDFFVVCDDIWIAICPFFVVVPFQVLQARERASTPCPFHYFLFRTRIWVLKELGARQ
jgi:hypothetical protein